MRCFAVAAPRRYNSGSGPAFPSQSGETRWVKPTWRVPDRPIARRPVGFVEGNRRILQPRCNDGPALGETGGDACSPSSARPDGVGICVSGGVGRVGAPPETSSRARERDGRLFGQSPCINAVLCDTEILRRWRLILPLAAVGAALAIGASLWLQRTEYFWRDPIADARFQTVTDFEGVEQAAAVSRDGQFVAFLSDRDGQMDVWVTQVGSGQFHNLTHGSVPELVNPSVRTLGFSPDGSLVTFWVRKQDGSSRRRHRHLGGANAGRTAEAIPGRRG